MRKLFAVAAVVVFAMMAGISGAQACNETLAQPPFGAFTEASKMDQAQSVMRCKFQVHSVSEGMSGGDQFVSVHMGAVYEAPQQRASENAIFGKYTPYGEFRASIFNPVVAERLRALVGKQVYLDFTLALDTSQGSA